MNIEERRYEVGTISDYINQCQSRWFSNVSYCTEETEICASSPLLFLLSLLWLLLASCTLFFDVANSMAWCLYHSGAYIANMKLLGGFKFQVGFQVGFKLKMLEVTPPKRYRTLYKYKITGPISP